MTKNTPILGSSGQPLTPALEILAANATQGDDPLRDDEFRALAEAKVAAIQAERDALAEARRVHGRFVPADSSEQIAYLRAIEKRKAIEQDMAAFRERHAWPAQ
jgi:hypothetical protein